MKNLLNKLKELEQRDFDVVISRGTLALQQTQRNTAKAEIIKAIYTDIKAALEPEGIPSIRNRIRPSDRIFE